jgi:hypothetical protein
MSCSPFFEPLHDERHPVGKFGRGPHYSACVCQSGTTNGLSHWRRAH